MVVCGLDAKVQPRGFCPVCKMSEATLRLPGVKWTLNTHLQKCHSLEMVLVCPEPDCPKGFYGKRNNNDVTKHMKARHPLLNPEMTPYFLTPFRPGKLDLRRETSVLMPGSVAECTPAFKVFCDQWATGSHVGTEKRKASESPKTVPRPPRSQTRRSASSSQVRTRSADPEPESVPVLLDDQTRDPALDAELGYQGVEDTRDVVKVRRVVLSQPTVPVPEPANLMSAAAPEPAIRIYTTGDTPPRKGRSTSPLPSTPGSSGSRRKSGTPKKRQEVSLQLDSELSGLEDDWPRRASVGFGLQVTPQPSAPRQDPPWATERGTPAEEAYRIQVAKDLGCVPVLVAHTTNVLKRLEVNHPGGVRKFLEQQGILDLRPIRVASEPDGDLTVRFPHGNFDLRTLGRALRQIERDERRASRKETSGEAARTSSPESDEEPTTST